MSKTFKLKEHRPLYVYITNKANALGIGELQMYQLFENSLPLLLETYDKWKLLQNSADESKEVENELMEKKIKNKKRV